jgi:hypothetical protein
MDLGNSVSAIKAYETLVQAFGIGTRYEIGIVPPAFMPSTEEIILIEEECIGIPNTVLVEAFLVARQVFMAKPRRGRIWTKVGSICLTCITLTYEASQCN